VLETQQLSSQPQGCRSGESSDHAIGGPQALDRDHRALAAQILPCLGDDPSLLSRSQSSSPCGAWARSCVQGVTMRFPQSWPSRRTTRARFAFLRGEASRRAATSMSNKMSRVGFPVTSADSASRRMQPAHSASKRNASVQLNDQFPVDDKSLEWDVRQCRHNLRGSSGPKTIFLLARPCRSP
jgi:hypothetical protein